MGNENKNAKWYIVSTQSGKEDKVKENIDLRITSMEMQDFIFETLIAKEEVQVLKEGKPTGKTKIKNVYPRYLFVKMIMDDKAWFVIRNTPGVTGFIGSAGKGTKPTPVPKEQMDRVLKICGRFEDISANEYSVGQKVRILRGPWQDNIGEIISIDYDTNQLQVRINTMITMNAVGRFSFADVELI